MGGVISISASLRTLGQQQSQYQNSLPPGCVSILLNSPKSRGQRPEQTSEGVTAKSCWSEGFGPSSSEPLPGCGHLAPGVTAAARHPNYWPPRNLAAQWQINSGAFAGLILAQPGL